ncbi:type VI secretion system Vgr family protein, partial [Ideonella azotifigens]
MSFPSSLAPFDDGTRLYRLQAEGELAQLQVEAWALQEALSQPWQLQLSCVAESAQLDLDAMLGQPLTLLTRLSDGSEQPRSGHVLQAMADDSDGGLARYQFIVQPWLGFLSQTLRSQVWQDVAFPDMIDSVLTRYSALGSWRWSSCVTEHLAASAGGGLRPYVVQYRESDLAFVQRQLAAEGIAYRFEESTDGQPGPCVVFFADSTSADSCPEDISSASALGGAGLRFHRDGVQEAQDTVQAFGGQRRQALAVASATSYDVASGRLIAAEVPTAGIVGGENAAWLEAYDSLGEGLFADGGQAQRALTLAQQAIEARHKRWLGQSVVRSFQAGTRFALAESSLDALDPFKPEEDKRFLLTSVTHVGINNLPKDLSDAIAKAFKTPAGKDPALLPDWIEPALRQRAAARGYANRFEALRAHVPWRPQLLDDTGARLHARPRVDGPLLARVVGPDGSTSPAGEQEVHTDRLGRVRIRYEFQGQADAAELTTLASPWVRVLQPLAGEGFGVHWTPRIGHEVLVAHVDDNIDRPIVLCSLYDGRGEGGVAPTPGGEAAESDLSAFAQSSDSSPSAQGNLANSDGTGHSPAWHGGAPGELDQDGQRNAAG